MSQVSQRRFRLVVPTLLALGALFLFGRHPSSVSAKDGDDASIYDQLKVFTDVLAVVQKDYVKEINPREVVEGAIKGMLATLDPHSGYLDPEFYKDLQVQTKGEFGGLGIEITIKDGLLVVVAPMEDSPAEKAGVRAGDSIVKIDGKFAKQFSLVDAVKKLRGPKGSTVSLSLHRKGVSDLIEVKLIRDVIQVRSVKSRYMGDGFGYVRLSQFMEKTADDLKTALRKLHSQAPNSQLRGLVFDMRNNPGGLLNQAVKVGDMFLNGGVIVYTDGRVENQKQKFFAHEKGTEPDYPVIVIVNGGSASAAEIIAGAFKDHGRALILGSQTFGKGSVQTISPLRNGGALTLTTALYYTKSGRSIQGVGVKPDIEMGPKSDGKDSDDGGALKLPAVREEDLPGAIKNPSLPQESAPSPLQRINKTPVAPEASEIINPETIEIAQWLKKDAEVQRALELLKTFNIFKTAGPLAEAGSGNGLQSSAVNQPQS